MSLVFSSPDVTQHEAFAALCAAATPSGSIIYLDGDLGAGKTTFARGFLHALGHKGAVKSPTYTLVEPYEFNNLSVYHFDLYRLRDPEELEWLGLRDYQQGNFVWLVEWPSQGEPILPPADIIFQFKVAGEGREISVQALSEKGQTILKQIPIAV